MSYYAKIICFPFFGSAGCVHIHVAFSTNLSKPLITNRIADPTNTQIITWITAHYGPTNWFFGIYNDKNQEYENTYLIPSLLVTNEFGIQNYLRF